jgi:hypothetical protein
MPIKLIHEQIQIDDEEKIEEGIRNWRIKLTHSLTRIR